MLNSDLWRDFASQFQALSSPYADVRGTYQYVVGSGVTGNWMLSAAGAPGLRIQFEALARRAAAVIPNRHSSDLLIAWLEALREAGTDFRIEGFPYELNDDGSRGAMYVMGFIDRLCEASANFCRKLESAALQAEFEAEHSTAEQTTQPDAIAAKPTRKEFVLPLLEAKGWSVLDWANEANVSHATAMDYLQDKTAPYRSTRLKLAKALGVPVEHLPK